MMKTFAPERSLDPVPFLLPLVVSLGNVHIIQITHFIKTLPILIQFNPQQQQQQKLLDGSRRNYA